MGFKAVYACIAPVDGSDAFFRSDNIPIPAGRAPETNSTQKATIFVGPKRKKPSQPSKTSACARCVSYRNAPSSWRYRSSHDRLGQQSRHRASGIRFTTDHCCCHPAGLDLAGPSSVGHLGCSHHRRTAAAAVHHSRRRTVGHHPTVHHRSLVPS